MASIRKRGSRINVQIRKKGYPLVSKSFLSLTVAKKWAVVTEADMERCLHVAIPDDTTVGNLLDRYIKEILPTHKGQQVERYRLGTLKRYFGPMRVTDLTAQEVAKYRDHRLKEVSAASLKRELVILRRVLTLASKDWGIALPQNPVRMITLPKADKARTRRLEAGEEEKLLQITNQKLRRVIILALETAMRRGEILNIKKSHINYSKSVLLIPSTKNDQSRTIPLSSQALTALRGQLRASQRLFGGVISLVESTVFDYKPRGLSGEFLKLCRRKGIENLHFHDLRHEATSRLFEKGLNPVEVATITGHKDTKMLMRYTHLRAEDLVERLG
jgi:integrase